MPNAELRCRAPGQWVCELGSGHRRGSPPVRLPGYRPSGPKSVPGQRSDQTLGIEHGFVLEHEVNRPGNLDRQDGIGFELVGPGFQPLGQRSDYCMIAFGDHRGFTEGPAQIRVAELGPAQAFDLAGTGHRAFDQSRVTQEILHGRESLDITDLVEDSGSEVFANARYRLEQRILPPGYRSGELLKVLFQRRDLLVVMTDHGQIVVQRQLPVRVVFLPGAVFPRNHDWPGIV